MAKKPETRFKEIFVARLLAVSPDAWIEKIAQVAIRGTPDLLCCIGGYFVAIELKASKKAPISALQEYKLKKIEQAGGFAFVCYPENEEEVLAELRKIAQSG